MSQTPDADVTDDSTTDKMADNYLDGIEALLGILEETPEWFLDDMSDEQIVNVREKLKELEDVASDTRDEVEDELDTRVEPGESILGLNRIESHKKYVKTDVETVVGRAVAHGLDYGEFVSIKASKLPDEPEIADVGRSEYTYYR